MPPSAFSKCQNLKNIEIPSSVSSIYAEAFADCTALTDIKIPMSVTYIGGGAFYECNSLKRAFFQTINRIGIKSKYVMATSPF